jgi:3D (Asp-Asp-Asp) domain-containing protein
VLDVTCYVATGHLTASGKRPRVGMAAGNRWPFGTLLRVEHVGVVRVEDRIGHSSDLDLFYADRAACLRFGRQQLRVEVIR